MSTPESVNPTNDHVDLASYLMEMLTPAERTRAEEHLATCAECRDEIDSLREWSDKLAEVPEPMLLDGPPEDADLLLQRTLRQVRQESSGDRRRRFAMLAAAAAAVLVVAIGGGVVLGRGTAPEGGIQAQPSASAVPGTRTASATDPVSGARMTATVIPAAGWVRLTATVGGIPAGEKCVLEVVGRNGDAVPGGSWLVSPSGEQNGTTLNGSALLDPAQVTAVRVVNMDGKQFVSVPV